MVVRWARCVVVGLIALVVSVGATGGQGVDDLAALRGRVRQLESQGKYIEALPVAEQYVALARQRHGEEHAEFSIAIAWLASLYNTQGRYAEAEPLLRRALTIEEKSSGPDHPRVANALNNLALLLQSTNRLSEAESLMRRALAIDEKSLGEVH